MYVLCNMYVYYYVYTLSPKMNNFGFWTQSSVYFYFNIPL